MALSRTAQQRTDAAACTKCGACCTIYKVLLRREDPHFDVAGAVARREVIEITPGIFEIRRLSPDNRCIYLEGEVGRSVSCRIYATRPAACREFVAWNRDGSPSEGCTSSRAAHHLSPLPPEVIHG